jgi:hypothetical protein
MPEILWKIDARITIQVLPVTRFVKRSPVGASMFNIYKKQRREDRFGQHGSASRAQFRSFAARVREGLHKPAVFPQGLKPTFILWQFRHD